MKHLLSLSSIIFVLGGLAAQPSYALERKAIVDPIKPKSLRLPGESKRDMLARLFKKDTGDALMHPAQRKSVRELIAKARGKAAGAKTDKKARKAKTKHSKKRKCTNFKNFEGYWLLDNITYYDAVTLVHFFKDACGQPFVTFYDGTQNTIRETNVNDIAFEATPVDTPFFSGNVTFPVEILDETSLRLLVIDPPLGEDDLRCTFRIQDNDSNVGYAVFRTDSSEESVDNLQRYLRLPERPDIQLNRLPSKTDWTNPVEMFNYMVEFYALLTEPQKAVSLNQTDYIGWANYEQLAQTMLTTGLKRTAKVSTAYRGGGYIGVWRTQFPDDLPLTTIHTEEIHHFNQCSTITISGFTGAYAELNGTHWAAAFPPSSLSASTPYPWQDCSSRQPMIYIIYDSSHIEEAYDPNIHGTALLEAQHGPITPDIQYRDYMAASIDFVISSFGPGTHTRLALWQDTLISVPETFEQLKEGLANDALAFAQLRFRTYVSNGFQLYWNPFVFTNPSFPPFNLNDPFGLGLAYLDEKFNYDITLSNYLDPATVKNMFFTVTGPVLKDQPITGMLTDLGYTSNGSRVVFTSNDFQTFPEPLVDEFGKHPYMLFAGADNSPESVEFASQAFFGGIIKQELTGDKTVAYIRIFNEPGYDDPLGLLTLYPLVFGRDDIPNKFTNNFVAAWASLLEELNKHNPDRYILDIRINGGGFLENSALASLFGGDRIGGENSAEGFPGNGQRDPVIIEGSGIQTVFNNVPAQPMVLPTDIVASVFP